MEGPTKSDPWIGPCHPIPIPSILPDGAFGCAGQTLFRSDLPYFLLRSIAVVIVLGSKVFIDISFRTGDATMLLYCGVQLYYRHLCVLAVDSVSPP